MTKKKRQKPEDFIGWKSGDGKLKVIGIAGKLGRTTTFKVTCTECSKDPELFPAGYFISVKGSLVKGIKPCGCGKNVRWEPFQYLILAKRAAKERFIVHGFSEEFHGQHTKLNLECLKDGYKWTASISSVVNNGRGCPKCKGISSAERQKTPEHIALQKCINICKENNYDIVGFPKGYKNSYSLFEYICKIHGKQTVRYNDFVRKGSRCIGCARDNYGLYGYYPERKDEIDFLYILNFNGQFIKVGRSFNIKQRITSLKCQSKIKKIYKLRIFTATHQEIYDYEQELLQTLRIKGFQYYIDWSNECFENDCQFILNKLLDKCGLEEVRTI